MDETKDVSPHVWTPGDGQQARAEGWDLFIVHRNGRVLNEIQGWDCPENEQTGEALDPIFTGDGAVGQHLRSRSDPLAVYASFEDLAQSVQEGDPDLTPLRFCRDDEEGDDGI
jgi:hypothetical protein